GGFTDGEIELLAAGVPVLSFVFHAASARAMTRTLLATYLGGDAAERVLRGNVVRGRAEILPAVIWYSDLVDFTRIADETARDGLREFLNDYAACLVEVVTDRGGHVLKFIGDGILAIFPDEDGRPACSPALEAALAAEDAVAAVSRRRREHGL